MSTVGTFRSSAGLLVFSISWPLLVFQYAPTFEVYVKTLCQPSIDGHDGILVAYGLRD